MDVAALFASAKAESTSGAAEKSLVDAARRMDAAEVRRVVQDGKVRDSAINLNARCGFSGLTARHWSAEKNCTEIAQILIDGGARVDARDSNQWTPLMAAAQKGSVDLVRLLLARGADRTLQAKGRTARDMAVSLEVEALLRDEDTQSGDSSVKEPKPACGGSKRTTRCGGESSGKRPREAADGAAGSAPSRATRRSRRGA